MTKQYPKILTIGGIVLAVLLAALGAWFALHKEKPYIIVSFTEGGKPLELVCWQWSAASSDEPPGYSQTDGEGRELILSGETVIPCGERDSFTFYLREGVQTIEWSIEYRYPGGWHRNAGEFRPDPAWAPDAEDDYCYFAYCPIGRCPWGIACGEVLPILTATTPEQKARCERMKLLPQKSPAEPQARP